MATRDSGQLSGWVATYTFAWLVVYFPLETYVTWSIAGVRGFAVLKLNPARTMTTSCPEGG